MGDGTTRKRRSKTGCSQCRTVSRKCDEVHPRCGRCQRLQFDCAYRTAGLTWKDETPKFTRGPEPEDVWTSRHAQSSDAGLESSSGPPSDADESTLIRHFKASGHHALHWSTDFTEQFFDVVGGSIDTCAALKEAILAFELLVLDAPKVIALCRVSTTLDLFQEMLNSQHEYGTELMWTTGFLVCHIAMQAGHQWTPQLESLLAMLTKPMVAQGELNHLVPDDNLDRLAGLDMDAWYVGKTTPSLHIWSTFCVGRSGIEPTANLPRSLMDLMARVPHDRSVESELQKWRAPQYKTTQDAQPSVWHIFRQAAILRLYEDQHNAISLPLVIAARNDIMELLHAHWESVNRSGSYKSNRMLVWPLFVAGTFTVDEAEQRFIAQVLSQLCPLRKSFPHTNPCLILQEFWKRKEKQSLCGTATITPNLVALEWGVEIGVW